MNRPADRQIPIVLLTLLSGGFAVSLGLRVMADGGLPLRIIGALFLIGGAMTCLGAAMALLHKRTRRKF